VTTTPPATHPKNALGLGPLEAAVMAVAWQLGPGRWLTARAVADRMDYHKPLSFSTVSAVVAILCRKGLLVRRRGSPGRWQYRAARPVDEHAGALIAALLDAASDPSAALSYALRHHPVPASTGGTGEAPVVGVGTGQPAGRTPAT
jgi:predicted transcriptional regulator